MTTDKKYTERDLIEAKRLAYSAGAIDAKNEQRMTDIVDGDHYIAKAKERYPMPKVKRPRVVKDRWGVKWMSPDGDVVQWQEVRDTAGWKYGLRDLVVDAARTAIFADLLATPFELVDADD